MAELEIGAATIAIVVGVIAVILNRMDKKDTSDILQRLTRVETKVEIFFDDFKEFLTESLHHNDMPEWDDLLNKFKNKEISKEEELKLLEIVQQKKKEVDRQSPEFLKLGLLGSTLKAELGIQCSPKSSTTPH